jgi:hypothetical protein
MLPGDAPSFMFPLEREVGAVRCGAQRGTSHATLVSSEHCTARLLSQTESSGNYSHGKDWIFSCPSINIFPFNGRQLSHLHIALTTRTSEQSLGTL